MGRYSLHAADQVVIAGYFLLLAAVGFYFWRRMRHVRDLFTGGNNIPWWLAGVSFYLTAFSAFTFVAYSEIAYRYGIVALTLTWSSVVSMIIGTIFLAGRWRRARIISPVEFLEARYSPQIRQALAWAGLPLKLIDDGLKIYATGIFISAGLGYNLRLSVIGSGVVMSLYTFMGGLWAVVVTDYVQFVILTIGVAVLFPLVFSHMGGIGAGLETIWRDHPAGFLSPFAHPYSILYIIAFYLLVILSYNGNWAFAQKFYSVRNEREARKAGILATILKILGPPLFVLPAMAAHYLMPELAQPPNSPQYTYAAMSLKYLPAGLVGLMIAAMFSATMSTLSGDFNVIASVLTEDIYHRLIRKDASPRHLMITGRVTTLLAGTITILIGIVLVETARTGLFEVMVALFSLFVGPMLLPMLAGLLSRRLTWRGATAGIVAGFISGFSLYLYKTLVLAKQLPNGSESSRYNFEAISILVNIAITLVAMIVTTLLERKTAAEHARIDSFFRRLDQPVSLPESLATGKPFSPMPVIGWTTFGVGCLLMCSAVMLPAGSGRTIDVAVGLFLCISGGGFYLLGRGRG